jgi:predicted O-methyltransferase YrrM
MHPLIESIYATKHVEDADGNRHEAFPASIPYEDGMALYNVVRHTGAKRTLEVGMAFGVSSLFILQALDENHGTQHTSIDPWQEKWWYRTGLANVRRAGFGRLHRFFLAPSYAAMPKLIEGGEQFDFVFIDGNHRFEYTLMDFMYADRLLNLGGCVMLHDPWLPAIRKVMAFIVRNRNEAYQVAREYMQPPVSLARGIMNGMRTLRETPYDVFSARYFARRAFNNYCVLRKIQHIEPEDLDRTWDCYYSF